MKMKSGEHMKWIKRFIKLLKQKWLFAIIMLAFFLLLGFILFITDYHDGKRRQPLEVYLLSSLFLYLTYAVPYVFFKVFCE